MLLAFFAAVAERKVPPIVIMVVVDAVVFAENDFPTISRMSTNVLYSGTFFLSTESNVEFLYVCVV